MADKPSSLAEFFASQQPPSAPPNLGNIPPDDESVERAESPEPAEPAEPSPPAEPEPESEREAAPNDELERLRKENEFLRLSQQYAQPPPPSAAPPQNPADLVAQYFGGYEVQPGDVTAMFGITDPDQAMKAAQYLTAGMRAAASAGAALAVDQSWSRFQQAHAQEREATQLRDMFYRDHADLAPYGKLVQQTAGEFLSEYQGRTGSRPAAPLLVRETAQRVRAQLDEWGIKTKPGRQRSQAPRGEMSGRRSNGQAGKTRQQKDLDAFMAATSRH